MVDKAVLTLDQEAAKLREQLDRQYTAQALEVLRAQLVRSRNKERVGSDIHVLRGREIEAVERILRSYQ